MKSLDLVRNYFDRAATRFDAIYEESKPLHQRLVDRLFRRVVVERFRLVCNLAPLPGAWNALDVGCGSGRYGIALARAGARGVTGVDVSASMLDLARQEAAVAGVADRCEFVASSFLEYSPGGKFDVVVAMGYFDYLEEPLGDLQKMVDLGRSRIFASFPKRWEFRAPIRKVRFLLARGFVRFYARRQVVELFARAGIPVERLSLVDLGRDWIACARVA
jgi:2-polyprenyl-3-methyl-5-hydroxy-6-metoxy-1,4-benzoquinol methylase